MDFKAVNVDGSSKFRDELFESLEPYQFSEALDFQTTFLAGYTADKYDIDEAGTYPRAHARMQETTADYLRDSASGRYTSVSETNCSVSVEKTRTLKAMYPVWVLNTEWEGKDYTFAMNGETGKFVGDLPIDKKRLWSRRAVDFVIGTLVAFILAIAYQMFMNDWGLDELSLVFYYMDWPIAILISLGIGVVFAFLETWAQKKKHFSVDWAESAGGFSPGGLILTHSADRFLYQNIVRTPIRRDDDRDGPGDHD